MKIYNDRLKLSKIEKKKLTHSLNLYNRIFLYTQ